MIKPTVGRVVWFYPTQEFLERRSMQCITADQPFTAQVTYVFSDTMVNLSITDHYGRIIGQTSVQLIQDEDIAPENEIYAAWMPYQKSQAIKAEALEKVIVDSKADRIDSITLERSHQALEMKERIFEVLISQQGGNAIEVAKKAQEIAKIFTQDL